MAHLFEETRLVGVLNAPSIARAMAAAPYLDAGLHDLDLPARRRDAQPEAGQGTVEQEGVLGLWLALAGQARGESTVGMAGSSLALRGPSGQGRMDTPDTRSAASETDWSDRWV